MFTTTCNSHAKISVKKLLINFYVENKSFLQVFSILSTSFPTNLSPLFNSILIHYSTGPTTNTTIII